MLYENKYPELFGTWKYYQIDSETHSRLDYHFKATGQDLNGFYNAIMGYLYVGHFEAVYVAFCDSYAIFDRHNYSQIYDGILDREYFKEIINDVGNNLLLDYSAI